ncbi:MAG: tRNA (adenosine(37)-N6)-threonylcarbamoyltransferase complex dimerization subunit type 1 TsaB [Nitrospiraceae bacterium]|nr:tRNA (adenosine(37)-N6)-threonylcarbamoyltransferase complex dimerization subunit type 1 TsaB [Nitrospiraceae bacterium]
MIVLGIESATRTGGVALVSEKGVLAEYTLNIEVTHSERLMSTVDRVLCDTGISLADIAGIAVSSGPGSFTGLRIGIATAKGLAFATRKPVAAVPTLMALAWNAGGGEAVCPLLDAKKKEVYAAVYRIEEGTVATILPERVLSLADLARDLEGATVFTGEGAVLFRSEIRSLLGERARFAPLAAAVPSAASVAELGMQRILSGQLADPDGLAPVYIRRPEAEIAWEKRRQSR